MDTIASFDGSLPPAHPSFSLTSPQCTSIVQEHRGAEPVHGELERVAGPWSKSIFMLLYSGLCCSTIHVSDVTSRAALHWLGCVLLKQSLKAMLDQVLHCLQVSNPHPRGLIIVVSRTLLLLIVNEQVCLSRSFLSPSQAAVFQSPSPRSLCL